MESGGGGGGWSTKGRSIGGAPRENQQELKAELTIIGSRDE